METHNYRFSMREHMRGVRVCTGCMRYRMGEAGRGEASEGGSRLKASMNADRERCIHRHIRVHMQGMGAGI